MRVLVVLALLAAFVGVGIRYGKDGLEAAIGFGLDTTMPTEVGAHPWAPVRDGKPVRDQRVRFYGGHVLTTRCHATLGGYTLHIDRAFTFQPGASRIRAGCPGRVLRAELGRATHARLEAHGKTERLVLTDSDGHLVVTLQG